MQRGLDDTKRSIGVEGMEDLEKRKMFNKFQEHGGEVIKDDARKQAAGARQHRPAGRQRSGIPEPAGPGGRAQVARSTGTRKASGSKLGRMFERIALYFRSTLGGVMESSGGTLSPKFFAMLQSEAQAKLLDLGLLVTPLAHPSAEFRPKILGAMTKLGSVYFELLVRLDSIYDEKLINELVAYHSPSNPKHVTPRSVGEPLRELYKRIYILRSFSQSATTALIRALELQAREEKKDSAVLSRNIQRAKRSTDYLFNELLPRLHLAILNIIRRNFYYGHRELEDFLDLSEEDRIGFITERLTRELLDAKNRQQQQFEDKKTEALEKAPGTISTSALPDPVRQGLELMREFPLSKDKLVTDREHPLSYLDEESKMYPAQAFFEILDREYSFILTSNKIRIALDYQAGERKDVRKLLNDQYFALDETRNNIKEFNRIVSERYKTERSTQYSPVQKSQMLHKSDMERTRLDNQTRTRFGNILARIEPPLKMLLDDQHGEKHFLQNPDDKVQFDIDSATKRRLEGYTIIEAIQETYTFIAALRFRLLEGDLSGIGAKTDQVIVYDTAADRSEGSDADEDGADASPESGEESSAGKG